MWPHSCGLSKEEEEAFRRRLWKFVDPCCGCWVCTSVLGLHINMGLCIKQRLFESWLNNKNQMVSVDILQ